jgi:hypothetical protein
MYAYGNDIPVKNARQIWSQWILKYLLLSQQCVNQVDKIIVPSKQIWNMLDGLCCFVLGKGQLQGDKSDNETR